MELNRLQNKLISAARVDVPSSAVPVAFEQRVLAAVRATPAPDAWWHWSQALWRAAAPCAAVAIIISVWSFWEGANAGTNWSEEFEHTVVVAAVAQESEASW